MSKIKEIRKIENPIKELKNDKVESIDDEFEDESSEDSFSSNFRGVRRFNKTSTLDSNEAAQNRITETPQREIAKEDREAMNFRPSYTGAQARGNTYTPVGSSESGGVSQNRAVGQERSLGQDRQLQQSQNIDNQQSGERAYVRDTKEDDQGRDRDKDRKRNLM